MRGSSSALWRFTRRRLDSCRPEGQPAASAYQPALSNVALETGGKVICFHNGFCNISPNCQQNVTVAFCDFVTEYGERDKWRYSYIYFLCYLLVQWIYVSRKTYFSDANVKGSYILMLRNSYFHFLTSNVSPIHCRHGCWRRKLTPCRRFYAICSIAALSTASSRPASSPATSRHCWRKRTSTRPMLVLSAHH